MPVIYCAYDMFAANQPIRIVESDGTTTTIYASNKSLAETIADLCSAKNITEVKLYGNSSYLETIKHEIKCKYELIYSNHEINIEVN